MTESIAQTVWSDRRSFLFVTALTFLALAFLIAILPKRTAVRSAIEIGATNEKLEPLDLPEQVAKKILGVYSPAALLMMGSKGTPPVVLSSLQNLSVESIGRSVVMVSSIDPSVENEAKQFHEIIADKIIKEQAPRAQTLRSSIAAQISLLSGVSTNLHHQIEDDTREVKRLGAISDDLRSQIDKQQSTLIELYKRAGTSLQPAENSGIESQIRELRELISIQTNLLNSAGLDRTHLMRNLPSARRLAEARAKAVADAELDQMSFSETRVSLPPVVMPATTTLMSRRVGLFLVAFVISVLVGFGAVVLRSNNSVRTI